MANKKAKNEFLRLARIADYTAGLARRLADADESERRETIQSLKRSLKREEEQFAAIMRYLSRTPSEPGRPFAEERGVHPSRRLDAPETRRMIGDAFLQREALEDPDWLGAALCDLNLCRTENDFRLWAEEHGFEKVENLFEYIAKGRNAV